MIGPTRLVDEEQHCAEAAVLLVGVDERGAARDHIAGPDRREVQAALASVEPSEARLGTHSAHPWIRLGMELPDPGERVEVARRDESSPWPAASGLEVEEVGRRRIRVIDRHRPAADVVRADGQADHRIRGPAEP